MIRGPQRHLAGVSAGARNKPAYGAIPSSCLLKYKLLPSYLFSEILVALRLTTTGIKYLRYSKKIADQLFSYQPVFKQQKFEAILGFFCLNTKKKKMFCH